MLVPGASGVRLMEAGDMNQKTTQSLAPRVFFDERMVADIGPHVSPSSAKPRQVVHTVAESGLPHAIEPIVPATVEEICLAHDESYVRGVLAGEIANGFGGKQREVIDSLPYTSGAMLSAARFALQNRVAFAPVSGFHHAGYASGGGFCTFNGLLVTAQVLLAERRVKRVLIVDFDAHFGDGTEDIIQRLRLEKCVSQINAARVASLERMAAAIDYALSEQRQELILYQAGMDMLKDDPIGWGQQGWSYADLAKRDELVFARAAAAHIPIVWNLAGGYLRDENDTIAPVLRGHLNTYTASLNVYFGANAQYDLVSGEPASHAS